MKTIRVDGKLYKLTLIEEEEKHNENKTCDGCKHYLSEDGNYPLEPCGTCKRFYGDFFEKEGGEDD